MLFFVLVLGFFFLSYVWPTQYRYDHSDGRLVRIDRSTGGVEALTSEGWRLLVPPPVAPTPP
jgi:hypothetical protein